jgi:hypothetical protein
MVYDRIEFWFVVPDDLLYSFSTKRPFKVAGRTVKVGNWSAPVLLHKIQQGVISIPISSKIYKTLQKLQTKNPCIGGQLSIMRGVTVAPIGAISPRVDTLT